MLTQTTFALQQTAHVECVALITRVKK